MEDDEEIQSHASAGSGSPSPSPPNGRITVTVAAVPPSSQQQTPPPQQQQNSNALALVPIHQTKSNGGGREDCWSEGATAVLIEAWGERYLELSRGNLKQKHWKEVADIVSSREDYLKVPKTDIQCKNRIDTVKKKYKLEKAKMAAGGGPSKWPFYHRLDHLIGPTAKIPNSAASAAANKVPVGIPVGIRGGSGSNSYQFHQGKSQSKSNNQATKNQNVKPNPRKRGQVETESSSDESEDNFLQSEDDDDIPPPPPEKKPRIAVQRGVNSSNSRKPVEKKKNWGNSMRMLTQAILKFGEAYEQAESAKLQQVVEMEKTRMKFAKELELQRMQFFMKTQMEISQMKRGVRRGGNGSSNNTNTNNHHHNHHNHSGNNIIIHKNDNSDSDN